LLWGLLIVGGGLAGGRLIRPQAKDPAARFETAMVQRRIIESHVTATGTVSALVTVQVGSQVSGRIQELFVDYNSPVKKGQVIARIDPQLIQASVKRAQANLTAAKANLQRAKVEARNARRQAERSRLLLRQQFISQAEFETAEVTAESARTQVAAAEGALSQGRAALDEAEVNLRYTTIVSPTDGFVISRSVDVGQTVAASLQAPTLFTIAEDLRKMQVEASISEADVGRLEDGMRATFTVDAWPGERFEGVIRQIRNDPKTEQNVVTYKAIIDVENPKLRLKPGMTANVIIIIARQENVLGVPNAALRLRPPAPGAGGEGTAEQPPLGIRTVFVLRDGHPTPVHVKPGVTDGTFTEVEGSLREGDPVITDMTAGAQPSQGAGASQSAGKGGARAGGGVRPLGLF
jgi:HlyD family secretion protein